MFVKSATMKLTITAIFTGFGASLIPILIEFALRNDNFKYELCLWSLRYIVILYLYIYIISYCPVFINCQYDTFV